MNLEEIGKPVASIINTENKKQQIISIEPENNKVNKYLTNINITNTNEQIQQIPNKKQERTILYITGASGSGKSHYAANYIKSYKKMYPKNDIYLFSGLDDDSTLDKIPYIKRIRINDDFYNTEFTIEDFKKTLIIFDDTDVITDKIKKKLLSDILNMILQIGRHTETSCIYTSHLPNRGNETKLILSECHSITLFLSTLGGRSLKYLLDNYLGLDKKQIQNLKSITKKSRWVTIVRTYPICVLYDKGAFILYQE